MKMSLFERCCMIERKIFYALIIFLLLCLACRHGAENEQIETLKNIEILVIDGVNGSPISQVELKIYEKGKLAHELVVQNGKVCVALKVGSFYDFKLEGRKSLKPYYAASLVSSYLIEENTQHITILQAPLNKITKKTISPEVCEVKIENKKIEKNSKTVVSKLKDVAFTLLGTYPCEEIRLATPAPMMALGYVPSTLDKENISLTALQSNKKEGEHYVSLYESHLDSLKIKNETDLVIVAYDIAFNRVEHHVRIFPEENEIAEDENIKIENLKLKLEMYPTPSKTLAIGKDIGTGRSTHYEATLSFDVKKNGEHIECSSFALYRKEKAQKDFVLIKRIENVSISPTGYKIIDTDGMLEEGKEYSYKIEAFTKDLTKSLIEKAPMVNVKVRKPSPLLLTSPRHNASIKYSDAKKLSYSFKITEPQVLEDAKYMELGFMLTERNGRASYACKFKYVFNKKGDDKLYFAELSDIKKSAYGTYLKTEYSKNLTSFASKPIQDFVDINELDGIVTLTKDFITLPINLVAAPFSYQKGLTYYWDIVDWGLVDGIDVSYDDCPCCVVCDGNEDGTAEVVYYFNDRAHGSNAWNGREMFSIKY